MSNFIDFAYAPGKYGAKTTALSIFASWAWGVSILVGMDVMMKKGLGAFIIWASANALTLALYGWLTRKHDSIEEALPAKARPVYVAAMMVIQWFSLMVNLTAIRTGISMMGLPGYLEIVVPILVFGLWVFLRGYSGAVWSDVIPGVLWLVLLAVGIAIGIQSPSGELVQTSGNDYLWAMWSAVMLFSGPIMDRQMWQRRRSVGSHTPFYLAAGIFALYMILVGLSAFFLHGHPVILGVVIILVAGSTLASALSALSTFVGSVSRGRLAMLGMYALAMAAMYNPLSLIAIWSTYASLRVPFAAYAAWRLSRSER